MKILVSACLLGVNCRYDGGNSRDENAINRLKTDELIPVCPEEAGGLSTPRPPVEIVGGDGNDVLDGKAKVMTVDGEDKTEEFLKGARHALELAQSQGATRVISKPRVHLVGVEQSMMDHFRGRLSQGMALQLRYLNATA